MGHYKSNLRDLEFNLFEVFGAGDRLGEPPFDDIDAGTARVMLAEVDRLATGPLAASFADADRNPPTLDADRGEVTLPPSFTRSYAALVAAGWLRVGLPRELGGSAAPRSLTWSIAELILGANPAAFMYGAGNTFGAALWELGTAEQRQIATLMVERNWGSTMVLTEPDAGSDVGAARAKAIAQDDGSWHLQGVKRFITGGDWDYPENIVHLVLARPQGPGIEPVPGTKGLSLFVVPKYLFDIETGELGRRNGVRVSNLEHKMGLRVSSTCDLTFGEQTPAVGWLVGGVHDGIAQMFRLIEHARMMVGTKAIATLSTGYLNALDFARTRVQGADLMRLRDRTAPRVTIIRHPDIRRMLMLQKSYAEGMRALVMFTAAGQDSIQVAAARGDRDERAERRNDLMLPIVKGFGSERSYELLSLSLQTLGGSGYLQDYPMEQYLRDAKIDTLYEGTTAIQAQDLFFRKVVRDDGRALRELFADITSTVDADDGNGRLKVERVALGVALGDLEGMLAVMAGQLVSAQQDPRNVYLIGQNATRLLMSLGDLVVGWLLLRQAEVALRALDAGPTARDRGFYQGKLAAARFFATTVLPELSARRVVAEQVDNSLMDMPDDAF
ncbi:MAG: acyl-CoA dehydrogenase [Mycobacteriales bacterium]|nr:MAG: acyl-CoA dehydrogenase [Pseudonocardiales bacterium]